MAIPKLILLGKHDAARTQLLARLQGTGAYETVWAASFDDLANRAKGSPAIGLLVDETHGGQALPDFLARLARVVGPARLPVIVLTERALTPAEADLQRSQGAAGTLALTENVQRLSEQLGDLLDEAWFAGQVANLHELGGEAFVREMIDLFLELTPQKFAECRALLAAGDWVGARRAVHSIKSSAANLGAFALWRESSLVEDRLTDEQGPDAIPPLLEHLERMYAKVQARMVRRLA